MTQKMMTSRLHQIYGWEYNRNWWKFYTKWTYKEERRKFNSLKASLLKFNNFVGRQGTIDDMNVECLWKISPIFLLTYSSLICWENDDSMLSTSSSCPRYLKWLVIGQPNGSTSTVTVVSLTLIYRSQRSLWCTLNNLVPPGRRQWNRPFRSRIHCHHRQWSGVLLIKWFGENYSIFH